MEKPAPSVVPAPVGDIGAWEKHTKGFGLKLLQKFGFTGRLGANENGVSRAIEVVVRPTNSGLGFGDVKEASTLKVNKKIEAEWRGVEFVDVEEEQKAMQKKSSVERLASSKGWKKDKASGKETNHVKVNAEDFISKYMNDGAATGEKQPQTIIDMRYKDTRVITDMNEISSEAFADDQALANAKPQLGQELLYNINLLANMEEMNVTRDSKQLAREVHKIATLREDRSLLERGIGNETARLARLQKILTILSRIEEKLGVQVASSSGDSVAERGDENTTKPVISLASVCNLVRTLHQNFSEEFQIFGLINLLPNLISRVIVAEAWRPFEDHAYLCEMYDSMAPLVAYFEAQDQRQLVRQTTEAFYKVVELRFLPVVRRAVASGWEVTQQPDVCVRLFESLRLVLPAATFDQTVDMFLLPKLIATVNTWRPAVGVQGADQPSIHSWVHPWLPLLTTKLSVLYPEIRRKFGTLLSNFAYADSTHVVDLLVPWMDVFNSTSFENLLVRSALPRLVHTLRAELVIDPAQQDITPVQCVLVWARLSPVLPLTHLACLWVGEFFPKWLRVLYSWLTSHADEILLTGASASLGSVEAPDFEEVSAWYSGWKGLFPEDLLAQQEVADCFNLALDMMQTSLMMLEGEEALGSATSSSQGINPGHPMYAFKQAIERMEDADYYTRIEQRKTVQRAQRRLDALQAEDSAAYANNLKQATAIGASSSHQQVTFKEVVERFAARHNVEFMPKMGRYFEGKQLWQFGRALCYLDQNVVFVSAAGADKPGKRAPSASASASASSADTASRQELYGWAPIALDDLLSQA